LRFSFHYAAAAFIDIFRHYALRHYHFAFFAITILFTPFSLFMITPMPLMPPFFSL